MNIPRRPCDLTGDLTGDLLVVLHQMGRPASKRELSMAIGQAVNKDSVANYIRAWHARGLLYIACWDSCVRPRYALAPVIGTPDAERPPKRVPVW